MLEDIKNIFTFIWNALGRLAAMVWHYLWLIASWYLNLFRGRRWYVKILSAIGSIIVFFFLYLGAVDINFLGLFGKSPSMRTIVSTHPDLSSEIYSSDGVLLGKYFSENRTAVTYDEVNPVFWQALIDTEDERFYHHIGIDFGAFFAAAKDYVVNDDARGASTITQQLAKNLFRIRTQYSTGLLGRVPGLRIVIIKTKEWITALKLEWHFTKEEILTMYANTVDFGSNAYGIYTACQTYFGIHPRDLKAEQAAMLVGMLKATTTYNPRLHPDKSLSRRNVVLSNMLQNQHLTQAEYDSLKLLPIDLHYSVEHASDGLAPYFRKAIEENLKSWCHQNGYNLYTDGLKIYTTLDSHLQRYAEQAVSEQMRQVQQSFNTYWGATTPWRDEQYREIPNFIENIAKRTPHYRYLQQRFPNAPDSIDFYLNQPHPVSLFSYSGPVERNMSTMDSIRYMVRFMHCGFVAMEPHTGYVKAWVGDVDYDSWQYDKVTAQRQPGSTFKLFVYTEAMNQGLTPCDTRVDSYTPILTNGDTVASPHAWVPHNSSGYTSNKSIPLKAAFAQSINTIAAKLGQELGIDRVAHTAHIMGIKSRLEEVPSLSLGASDVNLLEMVNAYSTIVNDGVHLPPVMVTRILDREGHDIYNTTLHEKRAVSYHTAFLMQQMLMGGLSGTSWRLWNYVRPYYADTDFGGKTGTSNNHSDAWFIGTTPHLVCGAWVGGEYRSIHFRSGALGQGGTTALPICGRFYQSVLADSCFLQYHGKFLPPHDENLRGIMYQCPAHVDLTDSTAIDTLMSNMYFINISSAPIHQSEEVTNHNLHTEKTPSIPSIEKEF